MSNQVLLRRLRRAWLPIVALLSFWWLALLIWSVGAAAPSWLILGVVPVAIGVALWHYFTLQPQHRDSGRRLVMFVIGTSLFGISVWTQRNVQIEGLFFGLLTGVMEGALIHYMLAKIIGPVIFGRVWCGWACWIGAVLDTLPFRRAAPRVARWPHLRYVHFGLSLLLVTALWFGTGYALGGLGATAVRWFLVGNALYLTLGITLAIVLRDNRAFCKYLCPVTIPLKISSRFALLRVRGDRSRCEQDHACVRVCPMGIQITDYIQRGERVLSTECVLCQECIYVCDHQALSLSFGFDLGGRERLIEQPPATAAR